MNTRHENEEAIFDDARRITNPAERAAFLQRACNGDVALRERLTELLTFEPQAQEFFNGVVENVSATGLAENFPADTAVVDEQIGTVIGRYKLLEKIGEGGCGVVYMAEQKEPVRRRVALKIIKLGMDTKSVVARFEAERQALALMDHPNIARALDAGATEAGRPFFVMELVRGFKFTEYCDQNNLPMPQRLDLFVQVCHAIQHAHQKGVVHRDIKPSNILVTLHDGVPVPKVIDFGIAKAIEEPLTDKTLFTAYAQLIGTPAYMSPEQAEMSGLDIDTRSDIYSLGVLLYEILTGKTPFDGQQLVKSGVDNLRRTLRETEPQRPSTMVTTMLANELTATAQRRQSEPTKLISTLDGDLDWIVMKALEKDRQRRYQTANGLALDVQRYLANEPVLARPPSRFYRLQKLVRRNKIVFAAGTAVVVALLFGLGISTVMFFREREARRIAVEARHEAERGRANEILLRQETESREKIIQAAVLLRNEHYAEADQLIAALPPNQQTMEGATVFRALGIWHALRGEWQPASERFAILLRINQPEEIDTSSLDFSAQAPVLVLQRDVNAYDHLRREMIRRFADVAEARVDERILKNSLLIPADAKAIATLDPIAQYLTSYVQAMSPKNPSWTAWQSSALGLYHYRKGEFAKGADYCNKCLEYFGPEGSASPRRAAASVILALCEFKSGKTDEAHTHFDAASQIIQKKFAAGIERGDGIGGFWFDWLVAKILNDEAAALLDGK